MLPDKSQNYLKTVVAFANTIGGKLIIGVEDKTHKVVGVDDDTIFQTMDSITNAIADACTPAILPDVSIQTIEGKNLIVVDVPMGRNRPYYIKSQGMVNGTYIRVSGTTRQAEEPKLKDLMFEGSGRSYDQTVWIGHQVTQADIDALCHHMKEVAIRNCAHDEMKSRIRDVTTAQLLSWHILEERDGELLPTHAWRMLNGDDDMFIQIQCAVFKGKSRSIFVDKREYAGTIDEQIEQAFQFVLRNIHLGAQIQGIYRRDVYEIPPIAIRELIINAVTHRNYLVPACIQVAIYDDRLEITSPGSLPMGMTIEKMKSGQSLIRNHALARALAYMNLIENWGSGIRKITDSCLDAGLKAPEFIDMEISVRVNIYRKNAVENTPQVTENTHQVATSAPVTEVSDPEKTAQKTGEGGLKTGEGGLKTGEGGLKTEEGGLKTEEGGLKTEEGGLKTVTSKTAISIIKLMRNNPNITVPEIVNHLSIARSAVMKHIKRLKDQGLIERIGPDKGGHWRVLRDD